MAMFSHSVKISNTAYTYNLHFQWSFNGGYTYESFGEGRKLHFLYPQPHTYKYQTQRHLDSLSPTPSFFQ